MRLLGLALLAACGKNALVVDAAPSDAASPDAAPDAPVASDAPAPPDAPGPDAFGGLAIAPASHDFGAANLDACPSSPTSFTVTNVGSIARGPLATAILGADSGSFAIAQDDCSGATLMPSGTCVVTVDFTPMAPGSLTATLQVDASASASLSGVGLSAAGLAATPCSLAFGTVAPGSTATRTFAVRNDGVITTGPIQVAQSGSDAGLFSTTGCTGQTLATLASCTVTVVFAPTAAGARTASIDVSASPGGTESVMVAGD